MIQKIRHEGSIIRQILAHPQSNRFTRKQTVPTYMPHIHSQGPKTGDDPAHSHPSWVWMRFGWSGLLSVYFRSLYTCRSQLEVLLLYLTIKFFKQLSTLCTVRGLLVWSHKRHLFLVSQYRKMTSSCLFFSFYYIGHIWPIYQVVQPHSQTIDSILGEELFLPLNEISEKYFFKWEKLVISSQNIVYDIKFLMSSIMLQDTKSIYRNSCIFIY